MPSKIKKAISSTLLFLFKEFDYHTPKEYKKEYKKDVAVSVVFLFQGEIIDYKTGSW